MRCTGKGFQFRVKRAGRLCDDTPEMSVALITSGYYSNTPTHVLGLMSRAGLDVT